MNAYRLAMGILATAGLMLLPAVVAAQATQGPLVERFDQEPGQPWAFSCEKAIVSEGGESFLRVWGGGHALWEIPREDFALKFRYRSADGGGVGDVALHLWGEPPNTQMYALALEPNQAVLVVRTRTGETWQERKLASGAATLTPGQWHDVAVNAVGGQIDVKVDGQIVLTATDSKPLSRGIVGLGVIAGSGSVDYDDASYGPAEAATAPQPAPPTPQPAPPTPQPAPPTPQPAPPTPQPAPPTPQPAPPTPQPAPPAQTAAVESFDQEPTQGWVYSCQKSVTSEGGESFLRVWGGGHALWNRPRKDFALKFRYRSADGGGMGDVVFRVAGEPPTTQMYSLRLEPSKAVLVARRSTAAAGATERKLASAGVTIEPGQWHDVIVQAIGGQIEVRIDGEQVLTATDTQPLYSGVVGLGVIADSGSVDYDDASYGPPEALPEPTPPTTPTQPTPPTTPTPTTPQAAGTDLAVTDIYATKLRGGQVFVRITNRGPGRLVQQPAELVIRAGGIADTRKLTLTLAPGETQAYDTGRVIDTSHAALDVTATISVPGVQDPQEANNSYSEQIPRAGTLPGSQGPGKVDMAAVDVQAFGNQLRFYYRNLGPEFTEDLEWQIVVNGQVFPWKRVANTRMPKDHAGAYSDPAITANKFRSPMHVTATVRVVGRADMNRQNNTCTKVVSATP